MVTPASFVFAQLSNFSKLICSKATQLLQIIMIAKITILLAVVAVAYGGVVGVATFASAPASTVKLADAPVLTYAHSGLAYSAGPVIQHAPVAYSAGPAVIQAAPVSYAAGPVIHAAPITYSAPAKVVQTFEPVEQHGYKIAY